MTANQTSASDKPIRVGVFLTAAAADHAIDELLRAGFTVEEITVLCSAESPEHEHFRSFEHQEPAGTYAPAAIAAGGALGAALGGLTVVAGAALTGGVALLASGGIAAWAGAIVGGLVGAMMTRGVEKELANYYNQAVVQGKILVAAEPHGPNAAQRLARAEQIITEAGAEPVALGEG
ncbi:MAG TPA: hypothetical protein VHZ24_11470 [Pirellulales bacterium]|jgi:hypothetical protein|nr:hypothetical protein [Pirellulales bacterium]